MIKYIIFTNILDKKTNVRYFQNQNRYKTFHAESIEEVKRIKKEVEASGHYVKKVITKLGTRVEV